MKICIAEIRAREILDSRGNPTVEADVFLTDGSFGRAAVPSGASTGKAEALEWRDGGSRYGGKGVVGAVENIHKRLAEPLSGANPFDQWEIDSRIREADGTDNFSGIGANAALAVSLACAHAAAASRSQPLWRYVGGLRGNTLPSPMMNILNGGAHADNNLDIQEFMIVPHGIPLFPDKVRACAEIYHTLRGLLRGKGLSTAVGDEGGFAPNLSSDEEALELISEAIVKAGYDSEQVGLAIDAAASEWQAEGGGYYLPKREKRMSADDLIRRWEDYSHRWKLLSIEDGLGEEDFGGWETLTEALGDKMLLVGDDLFVTDARRVKRGIEGGMANALLVKPNQNGTLSGTVDAVRTATEAGYKIILSHRSGETEDTTIADLAVGLGAPFIKTGAPTRSERTAKYNRLLRIAEELYG